MFIFDKFVNPEIRQNDIIMDIQTKIHQKFTELFGQGGPGAS